MMHAVKRTDRTEQSAAGSRDRPRRLGGFTPAAFGYATIVPPREVGEERENFPLQTEFVLPEQYFGKLRDYESGERQLLAAILEDAVACFQRFLFASGQRQRRLYQEAERWIMERAHSVEREDLCPYFSFDRVCDVLELDADGVRDRLLLWRDGQLAKARVSAAARRPWRQPPAASVRGGHGKAVSRSQAA